MFECWLETCLVPQPQPNQVMILDNATFHHGGRVAEIIEAGCQLLYLPHCHLTASYYPSNRRTHVRRETLQAENHHPIAHGLWS